MEDKDQGIPTIVIYGMLCLYPKHIVANNKYRLIHDKQKTCNNLHTNRHWNYVSAAVQVIHQGVGIQSWVLNTLFGGGADYEVAREFRLYNGLWYADRYINGLVSIPKSIIQPDFLG